VAEGLRAEVHLHCCHSVSKRKGDVMGDYRPILPLLRDARVDRVNLEFAYPGSPGALGSNAPVPAVSAPRLSRDWIAPNRPCSSSSTPAVKNRVSESPPADYFGAFALLGLASLPLENRSPVSTLPTQPTLQRVEKGI
jgi:hypothetical protein